MPDGARKLLALEIIMISEPGITLKQRQQLCFYPGMDMLGIPKDIFIILTLTRRFMSMCFGRMRGRTIICTIMDLFGRKWKNIVTLYPANKNRLQIG